MQIKLTMMRVLGSGARKLVSHYLDGTDQGTPPDAVVSRSIRIVETADPRHWSDRQIAFSDWYARHARSGGLLPAGARIDDLAVEVGYIHKLILGRDGTDFQYRIYGSRVASAANLDMQGRWVSDHAPPHCYVFLDHYQGVVAHPRLFVGQVHLAGEGLKTPRWHRADAPFGTDRDGVTGVIVMAVPESQG